MKITAKTTIVALLLISISILCFSFIVRDEQYYKKCIAKIVSVSDISEGEQVIHATIMNGNHKGENVQLKNTMSNNSLAYHLTFKVNDEVFINIQEDANKKIVSSQILDYKRDIHIAYVGILFTLLVLLVGGLKGLSSLASVTVNITIISVVVSLFLQGYNLMLITSLASVLFIFTSVSIVSGINKKTISAIAGTFASTLVAMIITTAVIWVTHSNGIHYEEMEFLTCPPEQIFPAEILIGTLGAIIDIAISISSSIQEIHAKDPWIGQKALINSGMEIGKDIMGTMSNTLVFAYISGSIPMILLWIKNGSSFVDIVNININLEIIRALAGSIGIIISIPITVYVSVFLLNSSSIGDTTL